MFIKEGPFLMKKKELFHQRFLSVFQRFSGAASKTFEACRTCFGSRQCCSRRAEKCASKFCSLQGKFDSWHRTVLERWQVSSSPRDSSTSASERCSHTGLQGLLHEFNMSRRITGCES